MPRAQSADGLFHDFPDGTDPAVIDRVMRDYAQSNKPAAPEKVYYNDAGQPFTKSGKPVPQQKPDSGYTGSILPFRRDDAGLHLAVPEAVASPWRGAVTGGQRASGVGEAGQDPLRPFSQDRDTLGAAMLGIGTTPGSGLAPAQRAPLEGGHRLRDRYFSTVKPGGIDTAGERDIFERNLQTGLGKIVERSGAEDVPLPRTLEDFGKATADTKKWLYGQYSGWAAEAEQQGARVDAGPAIQRMAAIAHDPLADTEARNAARALLNGVPSGGKVSLSPTQAEDWVTRLNAKSGDFADRAKGAAQAFREAGAALREELIGAVEGQGFKRYGELRRGYGSLSEFETSLSRAVQRDLNRGAAAPGATEMIAGGVAAAGHPLVALVPESLKWIGRWWKSPDRATRQMFREVQPRPGRGISGAAVPVGAAAAPEVAGSAGEAGDDMLPAVLQMMFGAGQQPVSPP
jgi:hypothetical protein